MISLEGEITEALEMHDLLLSSYGQSYAFSFDAVIVQPLSQDTVVVMTSADLSLNNLKQTSYVCQVGSGLKFLAHER